MIRTRIVENCLVELTSQLSGAPVYINTSYVMAIEPFGTGAIVCCCGPLRFDVVESVETVRQRMAYG